LGRAYRATADPRYAAAVIEQLDSWLEQCPFGLRMTWRSPLELAVRLVNAVRALGLIAGRPLLAPATRDSRRPSFPTHGVPRPAQGGPPPMFGVSDDGYGLDLGDAAHDVGALMQVGARLFGGSQVREQAAGACETAMWLFGPEGESHRAHAVPGRSAALESRA